MSYQIHPAADLFPLMSSEELRGLVDDIRANGQREPVTFWNGKLLDGRNRATACEQLGVEVDACELDSDTDPVKWVISHNLHRRHLSPSQKSQVALKLKRLLEPEAKESKSKGGKTGRQKQLNGDAAKLPQAQTARKRRDPCSRDKAASMLGISGKLVDAAQKVEEKGIPELAAAVASGDLSVTRAAKIADAPKEKQAAMIDEPRNESTERTVFVKLRKLFDDMTPAERKQAAVMWESWLDEM